jgi:hypothetical protein
MTTYFVMRVDGDIKGKWPENDPAPDWAKRYGPMPKEDQKICRERGSSSWFCSGNVCVTLEKA